MDDSCAVCADNLEWVAYGACGHKDVCSTCVARLRFICNDRRCCICKTECDFVFITKALGDYTKNIGDFSVFPSHVKEGRVGSYWYHEDTQAFFDDLDHYKMIKAMCRLSCSVCDKMEEPPNDGSRRRNRFRNIDQLKGHLFHHHRLVMCSLCLEGRKVFICEQKLYTRAQLNQHINTGDSEVDGSESERGGFAGHPICEFCTTPFYGDNELYTHMSTEHYTCHICQRQHPGQYEYYKNYDDLENHFRRNHFLCEDESCLSKKFTVFSSEAELKRHNTLEHGGRMSRSQRNAALQIPTSFRYRRYNEQENRRGRGRTFRRDTSDSELSIAIQASLETANPDQDVSSSSARVTSAPRETSDADPLISPFESLATTDSETPERYLQALSQNSRNGRIEESSFPPLPAAPSGSQQRSRPGGSLKNSMASHLRRQSNRTVNVLNSSTAPPAENRTSVLPVATAQPAWPALSNASGSASSSRQTKPAINNGSALPNYSSSIQAQQELVCESSAAASCGLRNWGGTRSISHSASAPNLVETGSFGPSTSDFPPVFAVQARKPSDFPPISAVQARKPSDFPPISAVQSRKPSGSGQNATNADVHSANKSLVERMRDALNFDEDKYTAFKNISGEYRQGLMDAETYLVYVQQFGLSHLVLELAGLCPDPQKKKDLEDVYNANLTQENGWKNGINGIILKDGKSKKGKGKSFDTGSGTSKDDSVDNFLSTVRKLQSGHKLPEEDVEVLPKDGYRSSKGKLKLVGKTKAEMSSHGEALKLKSENNSLSAVGSNQMVGDTDGKSKQRKKTSKFHRLRLGNDSTEATLDLKNSNSDPDPDPDLKDSVVSNADEGLPVRGVWRNGGGHRLVAKTSKGPKK